MDALQLFSEPVRQWFAEQMGQPTRTQALGWPVLHRGGNALVVAPTGTGKTLCAFLNAIDRLIYLSKRGELDEGVRVLYISPLKALGNDIERNLDHPLEGIGRIEPDALAIRKMVRTGDTPNKDRRSMALHPPHILITTPESLYLMLTSQACETMFSKLETVIVDEVHALLDSKRGTHLTISLERLARIARFQRIGLSATVEPMREAARFLGGNGREVEIVDAREQKKTEVLIECPARDYRSLPQGTIWPEIANSVYNYASAQRQTLVFCNNRMSAENVAAAVNRLAGEEGFARTHHGSVDKERRLEVERSFKSGELRCLCATSSLELGIDIGSVDLVIQVASPRSAARGLQRLGRAGHRPGDVSRMRMLPRTPGDALECALVGRSMLQGNVERMLAPRLCLDVLAQHIVSMACRETWNVEELYALVRGAYPYADLSREDLTRVLKMLRGDYEHLAGRDARPRIHWDEKEGTVASDQYGRLLAMRASTIPDRGQYPVVTPEGKRVGELDEEFVYESRIGDRFMLGAFTWAVARLQHDRVVVVPSGGHARAPFWRGDGLGRPSETGEEYGREMALIERQERFAPYIAERFPVDGVNAHAIARLLEQKIEATGYLPTDKRVLAEHYRDEAGACFVGFHCLLGGRVNQVLAVALRDAAKRITGRDAQAYHNDDGVLLHLVGPEEAPRGLLEAIDPNGVRATLLHDLPTTPLFAIQFRQAATIALMIGGGAAGKRTPLWVQRLRGAEAFSRAAEMHDHPLIIEAYRECMEHIFEVDRAIRLLQDIRSGEVRVVEVRSETPTQLTRELRAQMQEQFTYYELVPPDAAGKGALAGLKTVVPPRASMAREPFFAKDENDFYAQLLKRGTLSDVECMGMEAHAEALLAAERIRKVGGLFVAAHEAAALAGAMEGDAAALRGFLMRYLHAAGEAGDTDLSRFVCYGMTMDSLIEEGVAAEFEREGVRYFALTDDIARAMTIRAKERRSQVRTCEDSAYAALLPVWQNARGELPASRIVDAVQPLVGWFAEASLWEDAVLPARLAQYRPRDLDAALLGGEMVWRAKEGMVAFYPPEEDFLDPPDAQGLVYQALKEGGAQFVRQIARRSGISGAELERELAVLAESGLAVCDGFSPMRAGKKPAEFKHAARARSITMAGEGRWEAAGQNAPLSPEAQLDRLFDRWAIVSRECAAREGLDWQVLLETLRRMEFSDEVRRGYFVRGLSGSQFVRAAQFERITRMLENPEGVCTLSAVDPAQAYGQLLAGAGFLCVPGTAVVLKAGVPTLAFERRGEGLRMLGEGSAASVLDGAADTVSALESFAEAFRKKRIWPSRVRLTVKQYPSELREALRAAGFVPEMLDYTLWRD